MFVRRGLKSLPETNRFSLVQKFVNYGHKKVSNIGHWSQKARLFGSRANPKKRFTALIY
jgi:hypothetical protein